MYRDKRDAKQLYLETPQLVTGGLRRDRRSKQGSSSGLEVVGAESVGKFVGGREPMSGKVRNYKPVKQLHNKHKALLSWFFISFLVRPDPGAALVWTVSWLPSHSKCQSCLCFL